MSPPDLAPSALPIGQFIAQPGVIDLAWGHPQPELLPVEALRRAADRASRAWGPELLGYGHPRGPGPLLDALAARLAMIDGPAPDPASIVVTAGASHALDLVATLWSSRGDVVLVESPTYHVALKLFADHGLETLGVPTDSAGLDPAALDPLLDELAARGRRVAMLYTIPTFQNPSGSVLPLARRAELVVLAERRGLLVVEDDAYRELSFEAVPPPSLWSLAPPGRVLRIGSFSKTLAPGLRLGFITSDERASTRLVDSGLLDSGGGIAHHQALIVADMVASGDYARHVEHLRDEYRARRDSLVGSLVRHLPREVGVSQPTGGFFAWLTLPPDRAAAGLLPIAEASGVSFVPGPAFAPAGGFEGSLRVSFSRYGPARLAEAGARIAAAYESMNRGPRR